MNIADRIQQLRKTKGISQEELADQIGVSRQAVSKWESEQSIPDVDKIMKLSDYFEVTTDYLIKGIEQKNSHREDASDARIFAVTGTALNFIGLIASLMIWKEQQTAVAVAVGLILMAIGTMIYFVGQYDGEKKDIAKKQFWTINIWILLLIPYSCLFNFIQGAIEGYSWVIKPTLDIGNSLTLYVVGWIGYIVMCLLLCKYNTALCIFNRKTE